jgi:hypothetical protein
MARENADSPEFGLFEDQTVSAVSPLGLAWRRLLKKRIAMLALFFIAVFYFCGITAPFLTDAGILSPLAPAGTIPSGRTASDGTC